VCFRLPTLPDGNQAFLIDEDQGLRNDAGKRTELKLKPEPSRVLTVLPLNSIMTLLQNDGWELNEIQ
jgi:hypothetical protein